MSDTATMTEMTGGLLTTMSELAGSFPDVPFAPGVDVDAINVEDPDPFFITVPFAAVDAKSRNGGVVYDAAANRQLVEQINDRRPEGRIGHLPDGERSTKYDLPALMWVGAMTDASGQSWGKAYVPPHQTAVREYYRAKKRTGGRVGVSIYGRMKIDAQKRARDIYLETIDIVDPERVGIPQAVARPHITANMADSEAAGNEDNNMGDELIQEMVRDRDAAQAELATATTRMTEMQTQLDELQPRSDAMVQMAEMLEVEPDAVIGRVAEMRTELNAVRLANHRQVVEGIVSEMVPVAEMRTVVMAHMGPQDQWPTEADAVREAVQAVQEKDEVKRLAEMVVRGVGGPNVALGASEQSPHGDTGDLDERGRELARQKGISRR